MVQDIQGAVPEHLRAWWMPDGWQRWLDWHRAIAPNNREEIQALETDRGKYLGYVRMVGRRRLDARLSDPIVSVAVEYSKKPLLSNPTERQAGPESERPVDDQSVTSDQIKSFFQDADNTFAIVREFE